MNLDSVISLLIALLLIAVREGLVIKDMLDGKESPFESLWWHRVGIAIRGFIILSLFLQVQDSYTLKDCQLYAYSVSAFLLAWIWYNIAINLINGWKLGNLSDKGIDGFIKRLLKLK